MQKFLILLLTVLCIFGCQESNAPLQLEEQSGNEALAKPAFADLTEAEKYDLVAKHVAKLVRNTRFKTALFELLQRARNEHKSALELVALQSKIKQDNLLPRQHELSQALLELAAHSDIYFADDEHFARAQNGEAFLTTYWATTSDTPDHPLVGYHHDGSSVSLSVDELPTIPALVIAKCEHRGNHDLPEVCGDDCGGGGGGGSSSDNLILESIVIYNDHEPPWKGAPEIRMVFWNNPNNPTTSNYTRVEDLTNVDDENTVYNLNRAVYNWTTNGSSNGEILAEVMEDDGLPPLDGNDALAFFYVDRLFYSVEYLEPNKCRIYVRTQP